jgi:hypothetical protein
MVGGDPNREAMLGHVVSDELRFAGIDIHGSYQLKAISQHMKAPQMRFRHAATADEGDSDFGYVSGHDWLGSLL